MQASNFDDACIISRELTIPTRWNSGYALWTTSRDVTDLIL